MFLGKDELFKDNININKKSEEEKNNESIEYKNEKKFNSIKFPNDCNCGLGSSCFISNCEKYDYEFLNSKKNYNNCQYNNCFNKVPKISTSDKSNLNNIQFIDKCDDNKKVFCKCSKSGCKLKYCECFKAQRECTNLCRCFNCRNPKNPKIDYSNNFNEIYPANSIYIINNILFEEENKKNSKNNFLNKKRKNSKENKNEKVNGNNEDNLFDEKGQMIFKHSNLSQFNNFQNILL